MNRRLFGAGALVCAALLGFGYYLQFVRGLEPCPLCLVQRGFFYLVLGTFLVAAIHGPGKTATRIYSAMAILFAAGGGAIATRQVWLQHLPADKVPQCGPDLFFMLENFPLSQTLQKLVAGTGECAAVDWTFLGLSFANWSFLCFVGIAVIGLVLMARQMRGGARSAIIAA